MTPGDCPAPGCTSDLGAGGPDYDHLGVLRDFCARHAHDLRGVRERKVALVDEIEGLHRVLTMAKIVVNSHNMLVAADLQNTLLEQGTLLVALIRRERELTGAAGTTT